MFDYQGRNVKISVRNLVLFILCSGDINNTGGVVKDTDSMQEGIRIHKKIQRGMGSNYKAEYPLSITVEKEDFLITVDGRADGIIEEDIFIVDEIKSVYRDLRFINEPVSEHVAQAKCYAYIYANRLSLTQIGMQITYCNIETEEIKYFGETLEYNDLEIWFDNLINEYTKWLKWQRDWHTTRNQSIKDLEFPFEYRKGQKDYVTGVYKTIIRDKKLFVEAPTGVGKTISSIYPSVKALGFEHGSKIFYLTAKTIARTVAEDTYQTLRLKGLSIKTVTLTAKDKICIFDQSECNPLICERARGHYDRVNDAVFEIINKEDTITRELIEEYATKHVICPYEMSLDISLWMDSIICDYNYVFDPTVKLKRFFANNIKNDYIFLIDEAHNLVDRAREMYSASLYKNDFLEVMRLIKPLNNKLWKRLDVCNKYMLARKRECDNLEVLESITSFVANLISVEEDLQKFLQEHNNYNLDTVILDFYFNIVYFTSIYEKLNENYIIYSEHEGDLGFKIKLLCVDPSDNIEECLDKGKSTVFFSATLLPIYYYKELLGGTEEDYAIYVPSPFSVDKRLIMIGNDVSTKYTKRNEYEFNKILNYIVSFTSCKLGNYFIFFPSYSLLESVLSLAGDRLDYANIIIQKSGMNETEREEFMENFAENPTKTTIGITVMGGIFGEGIDLKNDRLIGTMIIGPGLPGISNERNLFKDYYNKKSNKGFEYAYLYPGMNKVLQAAGRVIRTEEDKGIILLLDERFNNLQYKELFPDEWYPHTIINQQTISNEVKNFWESFSE